MGRLTAPANYRSRGDGHYKDSSYARTPSVVPPSPIAESPVSGAALGALNTHIDSTVMVPDSASEPLLPQDTTGPQAVVFASGRGSTGGGHSSSALAVTRPNELDTRTSSIVPPSPIAESPASGAALGPLNTHIDSTVMVPHSAPERSEPPLPQDTAGPQAAVFASGHQMINGGNFMSAAGNIHFDQHINRSTIPAPPVPQAASPTHSVPRPSGLLQCASQTAEEAISSPPLIDSVGNHTALNAAPKKKKKKKKKKRNHAALTEDSTESQAAVFNSSHQMISGGNFMSAGNSHLNRHSDVANCTDIPPPAPQATSPKDSVYRPSGLLQCASQTAEGATSGSDDCVPAPIDFPDGFPASRIYKPEDSTAVSTCPSSWDASTADLTEWDTPKNPWSSCSGAAQMEKSVSRLHKPIMDDFDPAEQAVPAFVNTVRDHTNIAGPAIIPSHVEQAYTPDMEHDEAEYYQGRFAQPATPSIHEQQEVTSSKWVEPHYEPEHCYNPPSCPGQNPCVDTPVVNDYKAYSENILSPMHPLLSHEGSGSLRSNYTSRTSSIRSGETADSFADPTPKITNSHFDALHIPQPEVAAQHPQTPEGDRESVYGAIITSLPAQEDLIDPENFDCIPSQSTSKPARDPFETDEVLPLLIHPASKNSYLPWTQTPAFVSPMEPSTYDCTWEPRTAYIPSQPKFHDLGWLEYHLPDGTTYYVHPIHRVTTDCNLRADGVLSAVSAYLEDNKDGSSCPAGSEMWLRDEGAPEEGFMPARSWVDHHARAVVTDRTGYRTRNGKKVAEEDRLDVEYRYWSFIESHPAHNPLPSKIRAEALDVLNWAWTDRLLPSPHAVPAIFTQEECQELMTLLRSFGHDESQNENGFHSRIVSRILLRLAQWRQLYFRPNKPFLTDASKVEPHLRTHRPTILRAAFDFITSRMCPRIPYTFLEHIRNSGLRGVSSLRNASPMMVIGACAFVVVSSISLSFSRWSPICFEVKAVAAPRASLAFHPSTVSGVHQALWTYSSFHSQWPRRLPLSSVMGTMWNGKYWT